MKGVQFNYVKKILVIVCIISILASFSINTSATDDSYLGGLICDPDDDLSLYIDSEGLFDNITLPSFVDNSSSFPPPGRQYPQLSCVGWAVGYALMSNKQFQKWSWSMSTENHYFSPSHLYNSINGGVDAGSNIFNALEFIRTHGLCPLTYFPYNPNNYTNTAEHEQVEAALLYRTSYFGITASVTGIKRRLADGEGVVIGIKMYPDLEDISSSNETYDTIRTGETSRGNHLVCLVGYDDSKNAFKFINSWGTEWGLDGYGWISYDFVNSSTVNCYGAGHGFYIVLRTTDNYILGDIDEDGSVTATDSRLALRHTSALETFTDRQKVLADVDGDAAVTAADARHIARYASGLITQMPLYD